MGVTFNPVLRIHSAWSSGIFHSCSWARVRRFFQLRRVDEALTPGDFFGAGNLEALAMFDSLNELAGFEQ